MAKNKIWKESNNEKYLYNLVKQKLVFKRRIQIALKGDRGVRICKNEYETCKRTCC